MAKLIFAVQTSLDGYIADENGDFDWAAPDNDVLAFINDLERPIGTYLYGRRLYEMMVFWETFPAQPNQPPPVLDYAKLWQAADKIVYSTTLGAPDTARTRIERDFDPDQVRKLKEAAARDLTVGGAHLAAQAIAAGLVDEYQLFVVPAVRRGRTGNEHGGEDPAGRRREQAADHRYPTCTVNSAVCTVSAAWNSKNARYRPGLGGSSQNLTPPLCW